MTQDKTAEETFRKWLKTNYGIQDFEAYKGTQSEEIAIQYASIKEKEAINRTVQECIDKINTFAAVDNTVKFWMSELEKLKR